MNSDSSPANKVKLPLAALLACLSLVLSAPAIAALRDIYPDPQHAKADLADALQNAAVSNRRVIIDFGGNWCSDCHVLDSYFHDAANKSLLEANFVLVHLNIGRMDQNLDIAARYQIPLKKGVPALAVLDRDGTLLYSQKTGEFENMRTMQSAAVTEFLTRWKPAAANQRG